MKGGVTMSSTFALRLGGSTTQGPDRLKGPQALVVVVLSVVALLFAEGTADARPTGPGHAPDSSDSAAQEPYTTRVQGFANEFERAPDPAVRAIADARALNTPTETVARDVADGDEISDVDTSAIAPYLFLLVALIVGLWLALDWRKPSSA
jgi:hypothetical protein